MIVGVLKEDLPETRVSLLAEGAAQLIKKNIKVWIEAGAGQHAYCSDHDYVASGAEIKTVLYPKCCFAKNCKKCLSLKLFLPFKSEICEFKFKFKFLKFCLFLRLMLNRCKMNAVLIKMRIVRIVLYVILFFIFF